MLETFEVEPFDLATIETTAYARCPFAPGKRDRYEVTITYEAIREAIEVGSLRRFLDGYAEREVTAEAFLVELRDAILREVRVGWLRVRLRHEIAGATLTVETRAAW